MCPISYRIKWAASWQNQQNDLCAQRRHRSAWATAQSDQSSLSAWRKLGSLATHLEHSENFDQTGRMPSLIWVFAGRTVMLLVLSRGRSYECGHRSSLCSEAVHIFAWLAWLLWKYFETCTASYNYSGIKIRMHKFWDNCVDFHSQQKRFIEVQLQLTGCTSTWPVYPRYQATECSCRRHATILLVPQALSTAGLYSLNSRISPRATLTERALYHLNRQWFYRETCIEQFLRHNGFENFLAMNRNVRIAEKVPTHSKYG